MMISMYVVKRLPWYTRLWYFVNPLARRHWERRCLEAVRALHRFVDETKEFKG